MIPYVVGSRRQAKDQEAQLSAILSHALFSCEEVGSLGWVQPKDYSIGTLDTIASTKRSSVPQPDPLTDISAGTVRRTGYLGMQGLSSLERPLKFLHFLFSLNILLLCLHSNKVMAKYRLLHPHRATPLLPPHRAKFGRLAGLRQGE